MRSVIAVLALWISSTAGHAAGDESFGGGSPPRAEAMFTMHPPNVDGTWSEGEWAEAKPLYFPTSASDAQEASEAKCEVRFLWTGDGIYVAFRTVDPKPVYGDFKPGEPLYQEDVFEIFVDQAGDHRQYYEIQIDPAAQCFVKNYVLSAPPRLTPEQRLTPEFCVSDLWRYDLSKPDDMQIASKLDPATHTWTLEVFLPVSIVNRRRAGVPLAPSSMRINLARYDWDEPVSVANRQSRFFYWAPVLPGHPHLSPQAMGWLELKKP